jgi:hypothetical protein
MVSWGDVTVLQLASVLALVHAVHLIAVLGCFILLLLQHGSLRLAVQRHAELSVVMLLWPVAANSCYPAQTCSITGM